MAAFDAIQNVLDRHVGPIATKMSANRGIQAISGGMMATMPVVLGIAIIAIVIFLPIEPLQQFLNSTGLYLVGAQAMSVTMSMLAIYMVFTISSRFGESLGVNPTSSAVFAIGVFLVLMPLQTVPVDDVPTTFISPSYLGSNGIFMAIVLGLAVPGILSVLMKRVSFKLPDSVPPMVNDALSPTFAAIIVFTGAVFIKWGFTLTPWGNIFDAVFTLVGSPIMNIGSQLWAPILVQVLAMTFWFFGIHPSAITNVYSVVANACMVANINAFISGDPLPYLEWQVMWVVLSNGFTADGLPVAVALLTAKSNRFKAISRLAIVPAVFNISEPMMFGVPIVLNPVFFIPCVIVKFIIGLLTFAFLKLGIVAAFNPGVSLTWIMPFPVTAFLTGGLGLLALALVGFVVGFLVFYPFVHVADNMALKEEQAAEEAK